MIEKLGIRLYSTNDIADMFGITIGTARNLLRRKQIPRTRIGLNWYVTEETLKEYLAGRIGKTKKQP